eukprot:gene318-577_t
MNLSRKVFTNILKGQRFPRRTLATYQGARKHIEPITTIMGKECVLFDDISKYNKDWTNSFTGGSVVCLPNEVHQIKALLKYCNDNKIGVIPQGGNTGLVGGGVGIGDQIILSLSKMNKIISFDEFSGIVQCEAGCILEELNTYVSNKNFIVPLDLGAKGSCMIGGNVSTNAGGLRVIRYGSLHANILGLEIILPNGNTLDLMSSIQKDNTGYDLKHLFIGSEGTLGVITKVSLRVIPKPKHTNVFFVRMRSFQHMLHVLKRARVELQESLSAFEFIDTKCMDAVSRVHPQLIQKDFSAPTSNSTSSDNEVSTSGEVFGQPVFALIETSSSSKESSDAFESVMEFLSPLLEDEEVENAVIAQSTQHMQNLWTIRESITSTLAQLSQSIAGKLIKYDISIPLLHMESALHDIRQNITNKGYGLYDNNNDDSNSKQHSVKSSNETSSSNNNISLSKNSQKLVEIFNFGHMGDQNLHLNILYRGSIPLTEEDSKVFKSDIDNAVYSVVKNYKGSISAEHGIGQLKREALVSFKDPLELSIMHSLKRVFDPVGILNPGKNAKFVSTRREWSRKTRIL